jgi:hypothetical protein
MSFNNPFKKTASPTESAPTTPEKDIRVLLETLDTQFGADDVNNALGRLANKVPIPGEMVLNIPPASDQLLKYLEPIQARFGMDATAAALIQIEKERS